MKQIITLIISLTFLICQDTLKTADGKEYVGKLVSNSKGRGNQKVLPVSVIANLTLEDVTGTAIKLNNPDINTKKHFKAIDRTIDDLKECNNLLN